MNDTLDPQHTQDPEPWDAEAPDWDHNPAVIAYSNAAWTSLQNTLKISPQTRALDFGCGSGLLTEQLAGHVQEVVAVDASPAMIEVLRAKNLPNVHAGVFKWTPQAPHTHHPLLKGMFDLIVCSSVCAFLEDYPSAVAMLASFIRPGGHWVQWDWELDPNAEEPFGFTRDNITQALQGAGLEVVSVDIGFDIPFGEQRMRPLMGIGVRRA